MSEGSESRIDRLGDAIDAYLQYQAGEGSQSEQEFLSEHASLRDLLEPMLRAKAREEDADEAQPLAGRYLGDYRLVREIGRGGMGVVFEAEQMSLRRRVALKTLHPQLTLSARQIERFRSEAAAAAKLRHPGIVPVYEVGEHRGVHYFAMELVDGVSLDKRLTGAGRLAPTEAAGLVAQAGEALQFAHDHGLVHRDVKPHNILLAADGTVRLLDFGLAKDLESASMSGSGDMLGTVQYMSPEQVRSGSSAADARSDIFSLGVVLYELLTGNRPFTGTTATQVMKAITEEEPRLVRRCDPRIPRDLAVICHTALEKEPRHRYATAGDMAADLRRFICIEPILARPAGPVARFVKLVRRRKLAATAVLLGVLLFVVGPIVYAVVVENANRALAAEKTQTENERNQARTAQVMAFEAMDQLLTLLDERLAREPWVEHEYRAQIQGAVQLCEGYLAEAGAEAGRRTEIAHTLMRVGHIYRKLGHEVEALAAYRRGLGIVKRLAEEAPGAPNTRLYLARVHQDCMGTLMGLRKFAEAQIEMNEAVGIYTAIAENATELDYRDRANAGLVAVHVDRGRRLLEVMVDLREADRCFHAALRYRDRIERVEGLDPQLGIDVVKARTSLGQLRLRSGHAAAAIPILEEALREIDELSEEGSQRSTMEFERSLCFYDLGHAHMRLGSLVDAERCYRESIEVVTGLVDDFRGMPIYRHNLAACQNDLGRVLLTAGRSGEAEEVLRAGLKNADILIAERPGVPTYLQTRAHLGILLAALLQMRGDRESLSVAAEILQGAREVQQRLATEYPEVHEHHSSLGSTLSNLADIENLRGNAAVARSLAQEAIAHQSQALAANPGNATYRQFLTAHYLQLAVSQVQMGEYSQAVDAIRRGVDGVSDVASLQLVCARNLSRYSAGVRDREGMTEEEQDDLARRYADLAVQCLRDLLESAPDLAPRLATDPELEALRDRSDFQQLVGRDGKDE